MPEASFILELLCSSVHYIPFWGSSNINRVFAFLKSWLIIHKKTCSNFFVHKLAAHLFISLSPCHFYSVFSIWCCHELGKLIALPTPPPKLCAAYHSPDSKPPNEEAATAGFSNHSLGLISTSLSRYFFWSCQIKHTSMRMYCVVTEISPSFCWPCVKTQSAGARETMKRQPFYLSLSLSLQSGFWGQNLLWEHIPRPTGTPALTLCNTSLILPFTLIFIVFQ